MNTAVCYSGHPSFVAGAAITGGAPCVLKDGKLYPWSTADNTSGKTVQVFFAQFDADAGNAVSTMIAGNEPGTILAPAAAGAYTAGAPVYAADGGLVAASGTRVVGTALATVTLADTGTLHVVPQYVPAA